jgi:FG-GAP repeat
MAHGPSALLCLTRRDSAMNKPGDRARIWHPLHTHEPFLYPQKSAQRQRPHETQPNTALGEREFDRDDLCSRKEREGAHGKKEKAPAPTTSVAAAVQFLRAVLADDMAGAHEVFDVEGHFLADERKVMSASAARTGLLSVDGGSTDEDPLARLLPEPWKLEFERAALKRAHDLLAGHGCVVGEFEAVTHDPAAAGDFDGDGDIDLAVTRADDQVVFLYEGGPQGLAATPAVRIEGPQNVGFGQNLATLGDLDGDGRDELAISAPRFGNDAGRLYIFFGAEKLVEPRPDGILTGAKMGDGFGEGVAACDLEGHGELGLWVGTPGANDRRGRLDLFRRTGARARSFELTSVRSVNGTDDARYQSFGASLTCLDGFFPNGRDALFVNRANTSLQGVIGYQPSTRWAVAASSECMRLARRPPRRLASTSSSWVASGSVNSFQTRQWRLWSE